MVTILKASSNLRNEGRSERICCFCFWAAPSETLSAPSNSISFKAFAAGCIRAYMFLIGTDLVKDVECMLNAYDDPTGVTASFNLNLLGRINRELDADFDLRSFTHEARWNENERRIEMHLVSHALTCKDCGA